MMKFFCALSTVLLLFSSARAGFDWEQAWELPPGFTMEVDAEGFQYPVALAFVPNPGDLPKDPLYFVTELRGKVKVVTRDRSVFTFADLGEGPFNLTPREELPSPQGEGGLTGICLAPEEGYVFVSFLYRLGDGGMRHNIVRFEAEPRTFSLQPRARTAFTEIFAAHDAALNHQIGNLAVDHGELYVGVGDGFQPYRSQNLDHPNGKILRMTLDGRPVRTNPFYEDEDPANIRNFVWASGLRNPFSLSLVQRRLFVADNGVAIDRFLELEKGRNYRWDGQDHSILSDANFIWSPSVAPTQLTRCPEDAENFPAAYHGAFFTGLYGGDPSTPAKRAGIYVLPYDLGEKRMSETPSYFLREREGEFAVTGVAFGGDGLYFSSFSTREPAAAVYRITYDGEPQRTHLLADARQLITSYGCNGCHTIDGRLGLGGGTAGPPLFIGPKMASQLRHKLESPEYLEAVRLAPVIETTAPFSILQAREDVLAAKGDDRVMKWLVYFLQEPGFDKDYVTQMPNLGVTEEEAVRIAQLLLAPDERPLAARAALAAFPVQPVPRRYLAYYFAGGLFTGVAALLLVRFLTHRIPRRTTGPARSPKRPSLPIDELESHGGASGS